MFSYHGGHSSELCDHASDRKEEIIEAYIQAGFSHLAITEHLPPEEDSFLYPDEISLGHTASFLTDRFTRYVREQIPLLRAQFATQIELRFGFETEFYGNDPEARIERAINSYSPEIIVASLHHVADIPIDYDRAMYEQAVLAVGGLEGLFETYYEQQFRLFSLLSKYASSIPIVVGHMDLIKIFSPEYEVSKGIWEKIERNIKLGISAGFAFEVNSRGLKKGLGEPYPSLRIVDEICSRAGALTLGDDSHGKEEVGLYYPETMAQLGARTNSLMVVKSSESGYQWIPYADR